MLTYETTETEQKIIDGFIRWNMQFLKTMDKRNARDYSLYLSDMDCLTDSSPYERKRAARRILEMFLADWD